MIKARDCTVTRWRPAKDRDDSNYDDYQVSDNGQVISTKQGKEKLLSQHDDQDGYMKVGLYGSDHQQRGEFVHRLVGRSFLPRAEGQTQINHLDFQVAHNHYSNLEWTTPLENTQHSNAAGHKFVARGEEAAHAVLTESDVREIRELHAAGASQAELARRFGVVQATVFRIVHRETWAHVA